MKAYLYIGTEKTATTSIQYFLSKNKGITIDEMFHLEALQRIEKNKS